MKKREIICAFYVPDLEKHEKYNRLMKVIVENKKKIKPIYYENKEGRILMVFYKDRLSKIEKELSGNSLDMYREIGGKYRHCSVCRCGYFSYFPYTYRNNCGIVGRSYECEVCQPLSNGAANYVKEYVEKHGSKKAIISILKGRIFKNCNKKQREAIDNELPF